jgi:hypothetical protein
MSGLIPSLNIQHTDYRALRFRSVRSDSQIPSQLLVINYPTSEHPTAHSAAKFLTQTTTQPAHLQEASVQRSH